MLAVSQVGRELPASLNLSTSTLSLLDMTDTPISASEILVTSTCMAAEKKVLTWRLLLLNWFLEWTLPTCPSEYLALLPPLSMGADRAVWARQVLKVHILSFYIFHRLQIIVSSETLKHRGGGDALSRIGNDGRGHLKVRPHVPETCWPPC